MGGAWRLSSLGGGFALVLAAPVPVAAQEPWEALVAAERAFAAHSVEVNAHQAFLRALVPDGILFRPGPVIGIEQERTRGEWPGVLAWGPEVAEVSDDGTLGYTSGPYTFTPHGGGPGGEGRYFSLWRDAGSGFELVLDHGVAGVGDPIPAEVQRLAPEPHTPGGRRSALRERDREFGERLAVGHDDAYRGVALQRVRGYRNGAAPQQGLEALLAFDGYRAVGSEPSDAHISGDGTLGYSYGSATVERDGERVGGFYTRVWRHTEAGWRLVAEVLVPEN